MFNTIQYKQTDRGYKLYQSNASNLNKVVDWSDKFTGQETTGLQEVRNYINKVIKNGNKFATSNPDWFIDIKKENSNRKQKRITNKLANEQNYQKLDKQGKIRHSKYILELEELIKNAEYAPPPKEVNLNKKNRKTFIEKYHYFKVNVKVGDTVYEIILDTEQYKGESEEKPQTVHLYNIQEKTSGTYANNAYLNKPDATNIIADNSNNLNPSVNKHEEKLNQDEQENLFFNKGKADNFIRAINHRGAYIPAEKIIELYKNADASTFVHEMAHWYLDLLTEFAKKYEKANVELQAVRDWLKNDGGEFTREQHEKFARGFEAYIRSGYAKNNKLKRAFEYFKNFLLSIYDSIKQLGFKEEEMPQIVELFDRLLSTEKERIKSTVFDKIAEIDNKIQTIKDNEAKAQFLVCPYLA